MIKLNLMSLLIIIALMIVLISVVNERVFKLQSDIALVLFSSLISVAIALLGKIPSFTAVRDFAQSVGDFGFEEYLLDCVLCFMLFAGAGKVNMRKFKQNIRSISLLALLTTVVSSALYGVLFYGISALFGLNMDIWMCILLGCVVSPTDPIAATGILNKLGLSKNVTSVIESESLFNDGTGVALFVFVKSIVSRSGDSNFLVVMLKEILGALVVALVVSFVMFQLIKLSKNPVMHIMISILDVSVSYALCEHFGFSGVIASVICGMFFAAQLQKMERRRVVCDPENIYGIFWESAESILNAILFVMIGLSLLSAQISSSILILIPAGIVIVIISRFAGVGLSGLCIGRVIPGGYNLPEFVTLMTWSALKGGLSLALAMGTREFLTEDVYLIFMNIAYITIFFTVIVQGLTTKNVYLKIEQHKAKRLRKQSETETPRFENTNA